MFTFFESKFYDPSNSIPKVAQLRLYIKDELESRFNEMQKYMSCGHIEHLDLKHIEIAMITFGYNNTELLTKLTDRGKAIKKEKWAKVD